MIFNKLSVLINKLYDPNESYSFNPLYTKRKKVSHQFNNNQKIKRSDYKLRLQISKAKWYLLLATTYH